MRASIVVAGDLRAELEFSVQRIACAARDIQHLSRIRSRAVCWLTEMVMCQCEDPGAQQHGRLIARLPWRRSHRLSRNRQRLPIMARVTRREAHSPQSACNCTCTSPTVIGQASRRGGKPAPNCPPALAEYHRRMTQYGLQPHVHPRVRARRVGHIREAQTSIRSRHSNVNDNWNQSRADAIMSRSPIRRLARVGKTPVQTPPECRRSARRSSRKPSRAGFRFPVGGGGLDQLQDGGRRGAASALRPAAARQRVFRSRRCASPPAAGTARPHPTRSAASIDLVTRFRHRVHGAFEADRLVLARSARADSNVNVARNIAMPCNTACSAGNNRR